MNETFLTICNDVVERCSCGFIENVNDNNGIIINSISVQDKNLKSWQGKGLIGVRRKPDKPSWIRLTKFEPNCDPIWDGMEPDCHLSRCSWWHYSELKP
jgi:hypothetical protein